MTLRKYAHFQKVLQEHHFLKLNIINKLISKVKLVTKFHILKTIQNDFQLSETQFLLQKGVRQNIWK